MTDPATPGGFTLPAYGDRSLADVIPSVARALGVGLDGHPAGLELPPAPSYVVFLVDGMGAELLARHGHVAPYLSSLVAGGSDRHGRGPVDDRHLADLAGHRPGARRPRPARLHLPHPRHGPADQPPLVGQGRRPGRLAAAPDRVRTAGAGGRARHLRQQARVRRLRADGRVAARGDVRRRRPRGGADRRGRRGLRPRAVPDLRLRLRPRLDRPQVRGRLGAVAAAARDGRRPGRAAARGAAELHPAARGRRPRHGGRSPPRTGGRRRGRRDARRGVPAGRRGAVPPPLLLGPGGAGRPRHVARGAGGPGHGPDPRGRDRARLVRRGPAGRAAAPRRRDGGLPRRHRRSSPRGTSPTRTPWSGCTARSPRPRC